MATTDQSETIYRLRKIHDLEWSQINPLFPDVPVASQRRIASTWNPRTVINHSGKHKITVDRKPGATTVESKSTRVLTLEDLIAAAEIDTDRWQIDRWIANAWDQGLKGPDGQPLIQTLHQVKAFLSINRTTEAKELLSDLRNDLRQFSPTYPIPVWPITPTGNENHSYEISVPDLHFGKEAWDEQTGQPYNMDLAEDLFRSSISDLLQKVNGSNINQIIFPIGNDIFHVDNAVGTTTYGTQMNSNGGIRQHYRRVRTMVRETIDMLYQIAPVVVPVIPGNHDRLMVYMLGEALEDWYCNTEHITILNSPGYRVYHGYGVNLIGWTHGNEEAQNSLPTLMASESPDLWSVTKYREWHIGHTHRKKEIKFLPVNELHGVRVRVIPSLTAADEWHYRKGFNLGVRSAEGYLWSESSGMVAQYFSNI